MDIFQQYWLACLHASIHVTSWLICVLRHYMITENSFIVRKTKCCILYIYCIFQNFYLDILRSKLFYICTRYFLQPDAFQRPEINLIQQKRLAIYFERPFSNVITIFFAIFVIRFQTLQQLAANCKFCIFLKFALIYML